MLVEKALLCDTAQISSRTSLCSKTHPLQSMYRSYEFARCGSIHHPIASRHTSSSIRTLSIADPTDAVVATLLAQDRRYGPVSSTMHKATSPARCITIPLFSLLAFFRAQSVGSVTSSQHESIGNKENVPILASRSMAVACLNQISSWCEHAQVRIDPKVFGQPKHEGPPIFRTVGVKFTVHQIPLAFIIHYEHTLPVVRVQEMCA